ncbi:MAG: hypothetical protein JSW23_00070, partial [Planctomycetota bacterium]
ISVVDRSTKKNVACLLSIYRPPAKLVKQHANPIRCALYVIPAVPSVYFLVLAGYFAHEQFAPK